MGHSFIGLLFILQAEVSEPPHHEAVGFVDHPHPGQGADFDDEVSVTLPGKKDREMSKGKNQIHLQPSY